MLCTKLLWEALLFYFKIYALTASSMASKTVS